MITRRRRRKNNLTIYNYDGTPPLSRWSTALNVFWVWLCRIIAFMYSFAFWFLLEIWDNIAAINTFALHSHRSQPSLLFSKRISLTIPFRMLVNWNFPKQRKKNFRHKTNVEWKSWKFFRFNAKASHRIPWLNSVYFNIEPICRTIELWDESLFGAKIQCLVSHAVKTVPNDGKKEKKKHEANMPRDWFTKFALFGKYKSKLLLF